MPTYQLCLFVWLKLPGDAGFDDRVGDCDQPSCYCDDRRIPAAYSPAAGRLPLYSPALASAFDAVSATSVSSATWHLALAGCSGRQAQAAELTLCPLCRHSGPLHNGSFLEGSERVDTGEKLGVPLTLKIAGPVLQRLLQMCAVHAPSNLALCAG